MILVYSEDRRWRVAEVLEDEDYYVGTLTSPRPFPHELFGDLEAYYFPTASGCWRWRDIIHRRKSREGTTFTPYRYTPIGAPYPLQSPARQLFLARSLNIDPACLPHRLRIGMLCDGIACPNPDHTIPYNFFARTKVGTIAAPSKTDEEIRDKYQAELKDLMSGEAPTDRGRQQAEESAKLIDSVLGRLSSSEESKKRQASMPELPKKEPKPEEPTTIDQLIKGIK